MKTVNNFLISLKQKNISGYLIQIIDPLEINFKSFSKSIKPSAYKLLPLKRKLYLVVSE